jgi:hypothetical protein
MGESCEVGTARFPDIPHLVAIPSRLLSPQELTDDSSSVLPLAWKFPALDIQMECLDATGTGSRFQVFEG